jgi:hypothetical protein
MKTLAALPVSFSTPGMTRCVIIRRAAAEILLGEDKQKSLVIGPYKSILVQLFSSYWDVQGDGKVVPVFN